MKYLSKAPFASKPATKAYREGWELAFGNAPRVLAASTSGSVTLSAPITTAQWAPKPKKPGRRR